MDTVKLKINGIEVEAPAGSTIIQAANLAGVKIPSLCYLKDLNEIGACRICMVEVKGAKGLVASCVYPVNEGMEVWTNTQKVRDARKMTLELLLSNHRMECLTCRRNGTCELQELAQEFGVSQVRFQTPDMKPQIEDSAIHRTTPSAFSAAAAWPPARSRGLASSAATSVASPQRSAAPLAAVWQKPPACPVASAL